MTETNPTILRKFINITRTVYTTDLGDGPVTVHTIDAIADDGSAWWKILAPTEEDSSDWQLHGDLPEHEITMERFLNSD